MLKPLAFIACQQSDGATAVPGYFRKFCEMLTVSKRNGQALSFERDAPAYAAHACSEWQAVRLITNSISALADMCSMQQACRTCSVLTMRPIRNIIVASQDNMRSSVRQCLARVAADDKSIPIRAQAAAIQASLTSSKEPNGPGSVAATSMDQS